MQHISPLPALSYHKETQLLIAVGPESQLALITAVLRQLESPATTSSQQKLNSVPR